MSEYKHGAYATLEKMQDYIAPVGVGTLPVYFGRAPVHQLEDFTPCVGAPLLISSYNEAVAKLGYSEKWGSYELSEAVYAHFKTAIGAIGPIVVINVLNPAAHRATTQKTQEALFSKGRFELQSADVILSTVEIEGKVRGTDFTAEYVADGSCVILRDLKGTLAKEQLSFWETNPTDVMDTDITAAIDKLLPLIYQKFNKIPTLLCAPNWSGHQKVAETMLSASQKINGHWFAYSNLDLPCGAETATIEKAIVKKADCAVSASANIYWPMAKKSGRLFHLSTLATALMQLTDYGNDNVPYETASNKAIDISDLCLEDGAAIEYDQVEANRLNAKGIGTASFWGGKWVLWGCQTSLFLHDVAMDPRDQFDCTVRMSHYLANSFQATYGNEVDKPMTRSRVETICNNQQAELDRLRDTGALLLGTMQFVETSNSQSDMVKGDFVFDIEETSPPPAKSLTAKIRYTVAGVALLFRGED